MALWAFIACTAFAIALCYYLSQTSHLGWLRAVGILLAGWLLAAIIVVVVWNASAAAGKVLVETMTGAGNLAPAPSFSLQESLIARGRFEEAALRFEEHLHQNPGDFHARLALAALWRDQLGESGVAERMLVEIRAADPPLSIEFAVGNALIDLYRSSGQSGREMAELARFAERFAGTDAGKQARAALLRLKAPRL